MRWPATTTLLIAAAVVASAVPARAGTKLGKDEVRGFQYSIEDSFEQVLPEAGSDDAHVAAVWEDRAPEYRDVYGNQPTLKIIWTVRPKDDASPAADRELPAWARQFPREMQEQLRERMAGTKEMLESETLESDLNALMHRVEFLFGPYKPFAERLAEQEKPKTIRTKSGQELRILEVNYHEERPEGTDATWWLWIAFTEIETETETLELGFYGYADVKFAKNVFRKQFERVVKSFKMREFEAKEAEAGGSHVVGETDSPEAKRVAEFIKKKALPGWSTRRTPRYLIVFDDDVDPALVTEVATELEALRAHVLVPLFPASAQPDAITLVRICDSRRQFLEYGAPKNAAGFWSRARGEIVLNQREDVLPVAYSMAFSAQLDHALPGVAPHAWFSYGHGDYFAGYQFQSGEFHRRPFRWRTDTAITAKSRWAKGWARGPWSGDAAARGPMLDLRTWLSRDAQQFRGRNLWGIPAATNSALAWSFIYFLRATDDPAYGQVLPRYFERLSALSAAARDADGGALSEEIDAPERSAWAGLALAAALDGVDLEQLEKDWLAHTWEE